MAKKKVPAADAEVGTDHNSAPADVAADELKAFVERIERIEEEKANVSGDIREVYAELTGRGYSAKTVRQIVALRKKDHAQRIEEEATLDLYKQALGMLADTPLGRGAGL